MWKDWWVKPVWNRFWDNPLLSPELRQELANARAAAGNTLRRKSPRSSIMVSSMPDMSFLTMFWSREIEFTSLISTMVVTAFGCSILATTLNKISAG
ncbi:MAG: hypothetical protein R3D29_05450 [Nitratireductor sp.]